MCRRVWTINSTYSPVKQKGQPGHKGYCAGTVVCWIMLRRQGGDFTAPAYKDEFYVVFDDDQKSLIRGYQDVHVDSFDNPTSDDGAYKAMFQADVGDAFVGTNAPHSMENMCDIAFYVAMQTTAGSSESINGALTSFYIVRLGGNAEKPQGHVIAIEVKGVYPAEQTFRLMDPNNSCFEIRGFMKFVVFLVNSVHHEDLAYLSDREGGTGYPMIRVQKITFPRPAPNNIRGLAFGSALNSLRKKF